MEFLDKWVFALGSIAEQSSTTIPEQVPFETNHPHPLCEPGVSTTQ